MEWFNFKLLIKKISIGLFCLYASISFIDAADKIMPLGDSLTKGYINNDPPNEWGYRGLLWTKLREGGYTVDFVGDYSSGENYISIDPTFDANHSGVNNETTENLLARTTNTTLTNNDPQVVLLHIGTNDIDQSLDLNTAVTNVNNTLQTIYDYNSSIKVLLARIINLRTGADATKSANVTIFNDALETMANTRIANGDNIQIVNMESGAGIDYTTDMASDFHPNQNGYDLMAQHWYAALNGEVHHWALDETSSTTFLDAMGSADGTCAGNCPAPSVGGIKDGAQLFDGTNEVDVTETATFDMPADANFTIELWAKIGDIGNIEVMMGRDSVSTNGLHWWIGTWSDGHVRFYLRDSATNGLIEGMLDSGIALNIGEWYHLAVVRDGSTNTSKLYINGSGVDSATFVYPAGFIDSASVNIGYLNSDGTPDFFFNGGLDEIYVHNRALSAAEIQAHYNDSAMQITTSPVTFAEVGGSYYYDANTSKDPVDSFDWTIAKPASWMSINVDGNVTGTPDSVANLDVNITATKGLETATQNYVLKVRDLSMLPGDMVHYWKLDETDGPTYIDAYSAADATCMGSTCPTFTTGQVANAQLFDGTANGLDVIETSTFDVPADANFTIELWVKTNNTVLQVMIGRDDVSFNINKLHWWLGTESTTGEALFTLLDSSGTGAGYRTIKGTTPINDGKWHHIVGVRDGSTGDTILYVDGVNEGSYNFISSVGFASSAPVTIGYFILNGTPGSYFNGALDEIAVYGSVLSPTEVTQHYQNGLAGNELEVLNDTTPPVITVQGNDPETVTQNTTYTDAGATATDDRDGSVAVITTGSVNTATIGTYTITYTAKDSAGNTATATRTVNVVLPADTTPPVITVQGNDPETVTQNTTYTDAGATATDDRDGSVAVITTGSVNTATIGTYTITYKAKDAAGNTATATRTVNVVLPADTTPPVIHMRSSDIVIELGIAYTDAGATATDDRDGSVAVITTGSVDTSTVGTYTITYTAKDAAGNTAIATRTVNVVDTTSRSSNSGGGCTYNPNSKNFDMSFLFIIALGLFYPWRRRFLK